MAGLPDIPGMALDFDRHGESLTACRRLTGFFTVLAHEGPAVTGYSTWRVVGRVLHAWPARHWGAERFLVRPVIGLAIAEGRARGATDLLEHTTLPPQVARRWLGPQSRHLGDVLVLGG